MKIVRNSLKSKLNIRTEKDFPVKGIEFVDIRYIKGNNRCICKRIKK